MDDLLESRYRVRHQRNVRIPMEDGKTLAADLFVPDGQGPFPVVMDYYPYRKSDTNWSGGHDQRSLAERGFVGARIDVRGTGDSEGVAEDEYCLQEQLDGVAAIAWLAAQPWSNGRVGMWGASYGGFNALQLAMHRPPALRAICPMMFTDRRYTDDCHYVGGAMEMLHNVAGYGLVMVCRNVLPPRPDLVGDQWATIWEEHLAGNEPWPLRWLAHQTEDEQWRLGSLYEDYGSIECATYMFGGWRDGYVNACLRSFEHLGCPKKLLIGPWLHSTPGGGLPGPRINHSREMLRFFTHWLKGIDTGIMDEPPITLFVQEYDPPDPVRHRTTGHWRSEPAWPLARGRDLTLYLGDSSLDANGSGPGEHWDELEYRIVLPAPTDLFSAGPPHCLPDDQRSVEAHAAVYTTDPLTEPLEILGHPQAVLHVDSTATVIAFVVRLCDVAPDGSSALVTKGILNATHRESHAAPTPLTPGQEYELNVELTATSWVFRPGHRLRLSVTNADFPNIWPTPEPATSRIYRDAARPSRLILPVVGAAESALPSPNIEVLPAIQRGVHDDPESCRVTQDVKRGEWAVSVGSHRTWRVDDRHVHQRHQEATAIVSERDPARAAIRGDVRFRLDWSQHIFEVHTVSVMESDASTFHLTIDSDLTVNGAPHFSRHWVRSIPRHLL